jgi:predicted metal-dependent hydrolase
MIHLLDTTHNARFQQFMSDAMPRWQHYRERLNSLPLGHETWEY